MARKILKFSTFTKQFAIGCAASVMLLAVAACATDPYLAHYGFSFGDINGKENQGVEILNYRYGDNKTDPSRPADWQLASGHVPQRMSMGNFGPPGDSLYVKWRVKSTGKVYEDTVDLKSLLPSNMDGKEIHFTIQGAQLYVYLIENTLNPKGHAPNGPDCPVKIYKDYGCTRIYPDHWKNF